MEFRDGFLVLGKVWRAPVRIHWTMPLVALLLTRFSIVPGAWLGFLVIILVHELGHAWVVRSVRAHVLSINVQGFGGTCEWYGNVTARQRALIAWGGVLGQAALYAVARLAQTIVPSVGVFENFMYAVTATNFILIVINLLPIRPLDGAEAWKLLRR